MGLALVTALLISLQISRASATCSAGQLSDSMYEDDVLRGGQAIVSSDGSTMLLMGVDGSLTITKQQVTKWSLQFPNPNERSLRLQGDGNLVLYDICDTGECSVWSSGTSGRGNGKKYLVMQNDINLVLFDATNTPIWASDTSDSSPEGTRGACIPCAAGTFSSAFGNLCADCEAGTISGKPCPSRLDRVAVSASLPLIVNASAAAGAADVRGL
jgi:hypothetical protein